jgi:outer membrane protein insertion porin family
VYRHSHQKRTSAHRAPLRYNHGLKIILFSFLALVACREEGSITSKAARWLPWHSEFPKEKQLLFGEKVKIQILGRHAFSEATLRHSIAEQLERIRLEGLSRPNADDAAYYTAVFYHQKGYPKANVEWEIKQDALVLQICEGPFVRLQSTSVEGNPSSSASTLLPLLTSASVDRLKVSTAQLPCVRADLEVGASRIAEWYRNEGFLDVEVSAPEVTFSEDEASARVLVKITEGRRYRFAEPTFHGDLRYSRDQLTQILAPILSKPYTVARENALGAALVKFYGSRAHFDVQITVDADPKNADADGKIPTSIHVNAGPTYQVSGVDISGLNRLNPSWIQNRLNPLQNAAFNPDALAAKQQELLASGLFETLTVTPIRQPDQTIKLRIEATEAKARELGFSLGYGNYEGFLGSVRLADRNTFGRALPGSIELAVSQRAIALEASLADPWLFETPTELITRLFLRNRIELGYEKREAGLKGQLSRRIIRHLQLAAFGTVRTVEISNSDLDEADLGRTAYQIGTVGLSATYDRRDSVLNPNSGWITAFNVDSNTLDNGQTFARTTGRVSWHYPLPARIRFAASARFGLLSQKSAVPIDERFFLGGSTTVRSFQQRELGLDPGKPAPTGGSAYSLVNLEADFPLWNKVRGTVFFDTGSLSPDGLNIPTSNFRNGIGLGLRYALPVGPIRLDVGINPDPRPHEAWGATNLSFGFAF